MSDYSTGSLVWSAALLASGLYAGSSLTSLSLQSAVMCAVLVWSLFRKLPPSSSDSSPRLPRVRALIDGSWTSLDALELEPEDKIEVQKGDLVPADCNIAEGRGDFRVYPEREKGSETVPSLSVVRSGAALLVVAVPLQSTEVKGRWRLARQVEVFASIVAKVAGVLACLLSYQYLDRKTGTELIHAGLELIAMVWLARVISSEAELTLSRCVLKVRPPASVAVWRSWQAPLLANASTLHMHVSDEFVTRPYSVAAVLLPAGTSFSRCEVTSEGSRPRGKVANMQFDRQWFSLASACASLSSAALVFSKANFVCYGEAVDCALRVLVEIIGASDPGFAHISEEVSPEQYSDYLLRESQRSAVMTDEVAVWVLRKSNDGFQTVARGGEPLLACCSHYMNKGQIAVLSQQAKSDFAQQSGVFVCLKSHSEEAIQRHELVLVAALDFQLKVCPHLLQAADSIGDLNVVISVDREEQARELMSQIPHKSSYASGVSPPADKVTFIPTSLAPAYLSALPGEILSTQPHGRISVSGPRTPLPKSVTSDIILKSDSLLPLSQLIFECRGRIAAALGVALLILRATIAILTYALGKQTLRLSGIYTLPWAACGLFLCVLTPAIMAVPCCKGSAFRLERKVVVQTVIGGALAGLAALMTEYQCYLSPEWLLDTRSRDFIEISQFFGEQVQGVGLKTLFLAAGLNLVLACPGRRFRAIAETAGAYLTAALLLAVKTKSDIFCVAEAWGLAISAVALLLEKVACR